MTYELPRERWARYLDDVARDRLNAPTVIEVDQEVEERGLLLRSLGYDERANTFSVSVVHPDPYVGERVRHIVTPVARIAVDSREGIVPSVIAVEAADGSRTLVRLHSTPAMSG